MSPSHIQHECWKARGYNLIKNNKAYVGNIRKNPVKFFHSKLQRVTSSSKNIMCQPTLCRYTLHFAASVQRRNNNNNALSHQNKMSEHITEREQNNSENKQPQAALLSFIHRLSAIILFFFIYFKSWHADWKIEDWNERQFCSIWTIKVPSDYKKSRGDRRRCKHGGRASNAV